MARETPLARLKGGRQTGNFNRRAAILAPLVRGEGGFQRNRKIHIKPVYLKNSAPRRFLIAACLNMR